jgi:TonB family protein
MKKNIKCRTALIFILFGLPALFQASVPLQAAQGEVAARVRLYEGFRGEVSEPAKVISSYYLKPLSHKDSPVKVDVGVDIKKEIETLKRVFNLTGVKLVTDADMALMENRSGTPFQLIVLNGRKLLVRLRGMEEEKNRFKVEIMENTHPPRSLFRGSISLPEKKSTALGFEDSTGKIYFMSFHRSKDLPPQSHKKGKKISSIWKPRLLKKVAAVYPVKAQKARVEGKVVIEATTDEKGDVVKVKALEGHEMLRQAAIDAVKQWKYEPYIINGEKKAVSFTVVMNFRLEEKQKKDKPLPVSAKDRPILIKKVEPKYPKEALKKGIQGKVVLEAETTKDGDVIHVEVTDGVPELNDAAVDALKQWKYKPYLINGKKQAVKFTVVVKFKLRKKKNDVKSKK